MTPTASSAVCDALLSWTRQQPGRWFEFDNRGCYWRVILHHADIEDKEDTVGVGESQDSAMLDALIGQEREKVDQINWPTVLLTLLTLTLALVGAGFSINWAWNSAVEYFTK